MTDDCALMNVRRLFRQVHPHNLPDASEIPEIVADWCSLLFDMDDASFSAAVAMWLRDPEKGRFFPTISDLAGRGGLAKLAPMDPDEHAWEAILADVRRGPAAVSATVRYEDVVVDGVQRVRVIRTPSPLEVAIGPARAAVLQAIGGRDAMRRLHGSPAEVGMGMGALRKRFLLLCRTGDANPVQAIGATPAPAVLPDRVRAFLGTNDDPHAAARRASVERATKDAE